MKIWKICNFDRNLDIAFEKTENNKVIEEEKNWDNEIAYLNKKRREKEKTLILEDQETE